MSSLLTPGIPQSIILKMKAIKNYKLNYALHYRQHGVQIGVQKKE